MSKPGTRPKELPPSLERKKSATPTKQDMSKVWAARDASPNKAGGRPTRSQVAAKQNDLSDAYKLLEDLRYAYRNAVGTDGKKGRQRLMELMKTDADFKYAVKELLKVESSLIQAKIRKDVDNGAGGVGQQNFFVVLKGLHDDQKMKALGGGENDNAIDLKQLQSALDPTTERYEDDDTAAVDDEKSWGSVPV